MKALGLPPRYSWAELRALGVLKQAAVLPAVIPQQPQNQKCSHKGGLGYLLG